MTIFERLELIRAGYKRTEIDAMIKADAEAAKDPAPEQEKPKDPEPAKEPPKDHAPEQEKPKDPEPAKEQTNEVDLLKKQIDELKKQIQLNNIKSIGMDSKPEKPVEEVLAEAVFGNPAK